jgi:hypothetical protein
LYKHSEIGNMIFMKLTRLFEHMSGLIWTQRMEEYLNTFSNNENVSEHILKRLKCIWINASVFEHNESQKN